MTVAKIQTIFRHIDHYELSLCVLCNRVSRSSRLERVFVLVSRLGDGAAWCGLMLLLPLWYGRSALNTSLRMAVVGAVGLVLYRTLKTNLLRTRPYLQHHAIRRGTAPLDLYSFPSGHTLHAVAFSGVVLHAYPGLAWVLLPFATSIALSRVILGLHYPSDVLAGALIGAGLARLVLWF